MNGAAVTFPALHSGENVLSVPGISITGYQSIACSNFSSNDVDLLVTQLAAISPIAPSPTPSPSPSPSPTPTPTRKIALYDENATQIENGSVIVIAPSIYSGLCSGIPNDVPQIKNFTVFCVDTASGLPVDGCRYKTSLTMGANDGGHGHDLPSSASRPLGLLNPEMIGVSPQLVSSQGSTFIYEASDISQDVTFEVSGYGINGEALPGIRGTFRIQNPTSNTFRPISIAGLNMKVVSHSAGIYGTIGFISKLEKMVDFYFGNPDIPNTVSDIESQGASLPFGGLFDINRDWLNPHCGHRDGKTIDISIQLTSREKIALRRAIQKAELNFRIANDSPASNSANHWHVQE